MSQFPSLCIMIQLYPLQLIKYYNLKHRDLIYYNSVSNYWLQSLNVPVPFGKEKESGIR